MAILGPQRPARGWVRLSSWMAFGLLLAACQATPPAPTASVPTTASIGPSAAVPAFEACGLVTPDSVSRLLGVAPQGIEADADANHRTCQWTATGSGNSSQLRLGVVIRLTPADHGFEPVPPSLAPVPIGSLGDNATYGSSGGDTSIGSKLLIANKGPVSVSLGVQYGGSLRAPDSTQATMIAAVQAVFTALGY